MIRAFGKYHSIILVMRFYEHLASKWVDTVTLDKLTTDTFEAARRSAHQDHKSGSELASTVFSTCWRANLISYLADFSVHEVILLYGYYVYVQEQRRVRRLKPQDDEDEDERALQAGTLLFSVVKNSTLLAMSRAVGLLFSSLGGDRKSVV